MLLDSNVASNPKVQRARAALVRELCKRKCEVMVCNLPAADGVNGPDDFIAVCGDEAMTKVFAEARSRGAVAAHCDYRDERFEISDQGVVYIGPPDHDGNPKPPLWICALLHVVAMTRDGNSREWGRLLEWRDADGVLHQWAMPSELLQRNGGAEVRCELARLGLSIAPGHKAHDLLATYLQARQSSHRSRNQVFMIRITTLLRSWATKLRSSQDSRSLILDRLRIVRTRSSMQAFTRMCGLRSSSTSPSTSELARLLWRRTALSIAIRILEAGSFLVKRKSASDSRLWPDSTAYWLG